MGAIRVAGAASNFKERESVMETRVGVDRVPDAAEPTLADA
jgi:hypothetical protein